MSVKGTTRSHLGNMLHHSHIFEISVNMVCFSVTGRTLLMSPKGQNASRDGLVKLVWLHVCFNLPVIS